MHILHHPVRGLAWLFLLAGVVVAGIAYWQIQVMVDRELGAELDLRTREAKYAVEREIDRYAEVLHGLQAQFVANPAMSRRAFHQVARSLRLAERLPGIQALAFTQRVDNIPSFEKATQRELASDSLGYPLPQVHPAASSRDAYIVQYVDPVTQNYIAAWYDQGSEPRRRAAIERARDTGEWATSGRVRLKILPEGSDGLIFFLPIYRGGMLPATLEARRKQFLGVVFLVIRVDEMLRNVFGPSLLADLDIEIYDMGSTARLSGPHNRDNLIFDSGVYHHATELHANNADFPFQRTTEFQVGGSTWHVDVVALPAFTSRSQHWLAPMAAAVAILLSLMLFFFLRALELSRKTLHAHARAAEATAHLRERAMEACANAIVITSAQAPDYPVEYVNSAFERITGYAAGEVAGRSLRLLYRDDGEQPGIEQMRALVRNRHQGHVVLRNRRKDGTPYWSEIHIAPVRDDAGQATHFIAVEYDVSATRKYEEELEFQASRDTLTGLANRNLLRDRLGQAIAYADRYNHPVWVVFVDLNRFKFVIDTLGLGAGDELLKKTAERLQSAIRETDTAARLANDDFVLVLTERADEALSTAVVQRIIDAVVQPMTLDGHEYFPSCSVGVSVYPNDGPDADSLIKYAGIAVCRSRDAGNSRFQFYTPTMNEHALERLHIESDLRNALEREEFMLYYQPQVDLRSGRIVGMEALIRWKHPELGMVSPARFIGLAEETGMIVPIGAWVIRTACMQNKAWQRAGLRHLRVAVNLSVRQFAQQDLVESIASILEESGLEPHYLDIELTESLVMADVEQAIGTLRRLKALGVHLSIDDFGTGYSSLSYLKRFPIDVLKIDQSFVRDIITDPDDAAIARSVISMAHSLRMQVIAEGVETVAQLTYLRRHGCDQMQGYYFSTPVAADAFARILREGKCLPPEPGNATAQSRTLLIVNDETAESAALHCLLRQDGYRILRAGSSAEAFEQLALHPVQVIVSDERSTDRGGSAFLSTVKELYPDTLRIVLSGRTGLEAILDTINRGAVYRFFTRPWDDKVLRDNVREAFRHYALLHDAPVRDAACENSEILSESSA